jgi:peptide/nickel transport system substrate-binding protein
LFKNEIVNSEKRAVYIRSKLRKTKGEFKVKLKGLLLIVLAMVALVILAACAPQTVEVTRVVTETETITETVTEEVEVTRVVEGEVVTEVQEVEVTRIVEMAAEEGEGAGVSEFHIAWPYQAPPAGHFNTFVSDAINLSIYHTLMQPSLFYYVWHDQSWLPLAGDSWEWVDETTLEVKLHEGAVWSDGSDFTAQDVLDTFALRRLLGSTEWDFIEEVTAPDEYTVQIKLIEPSSTFPRRVLSRILPIRPSSTYGDFAQRARDLVDQGLDSEADEWSALVQEFNEFRPEDMVVLGPYKIDQDSITESQLTLNKNESSFMADWVNFDRIVNFNGETPDITPLVLARQVDYATHGFPPATEAQFIADGTRIIRGPLYTGPALYFNMDIHPFEMPEFRQALAYAIDRDENGFVSLAESGKRQVLMSGFADSVAETWLTDETKAALNHYDYDVAMAEQMLLDLGFSRDSDGVWLDDTGARMEFELTAPAEFADWSAAAENAAEQLTDFGIETTFRGVNFQQHPVDVRAGDFQMAIRDWGAANPHPSFSYQNDFLSYNGGASSDAELAETAGSGMNWPLVQQTSQGELDLEAMTLESGRGADEEAQKEIVNQLALAYNELLPQIPLWERYGNNPAPQVRVTGWPPDGDPIYNNGPYGDPFVTYLLFTGTLEPAPN